MSEATELISQGLAVIRKFGWTTLERQNVKGQVCALGALDVALLTEEERETLLWGWVDCTEGNPIQEEAVAILVRHIPADFPTTHRHSYWAPDQECSVADYNNAQTSQEVIEQWFEKAAADERIA